MLTFDEDIRILVAEDHSGNHTLVEHYLNEGFSNPEIHYARTLSGAKAYLRSGTSFDVILLDLTSSGAGKEGLVEETVKAAGVVPVIVLSGASDKEPLAELRSSAISDCLPVAELTPLLLRKSISYSIEKKNAYRSFKDSERQYKDLFDFNPLPMWVYEPQTMRFLDVNEAAVRHYGYSKEEFLNMTIKDIRPEEDLVRLEEVVHKKLIRGQFNKGNWRHLTKSGKAIDVEICSNDIRFKGRTARLVLANDITEKLEAERALRHSEQRFKALVQDGFDMIAILDSEVNYIYMSPTSGPVLGIPAEDFIGVCAMDYIHEEDKERITEYLAGLSAQKRIHIAPYRFKDADGNWRWLETIITDMTDDPAVGGIVANSWDVTGQMEKEATLKRVNERLEAAQRIAKLGHWTYDLAKNKSDWSEQLYDIWEADRESFTPDLKNMLGMVHPEDRKLFMDAPDKAFSDRDFYDIEHRIVMPDERVKWILERITLHRDEQGTPRLLEGIAQDITEHKMQEKELVKSLKEKEILLSEIHHRVKNNLAVVSAMIQLQAFEEKNEKLSSKLLNSVARIKTMAIIHEQLYKSNSFSRLEFAENVEKLVTDIIHVIQSRVHIQFNFDCEPVRLNVNQALPCSLIINEVVTNIVKHAFAGRESGEVSVNLSMRDNRITLTISDNGIGLPDNFEADSNGTLGLHIIDSLSQQLNAEYSYSSSDEGSAFVLRFDVDEPRGVGSAHLK